MTRLNDRARDAFGGLLNVCDFSLLEDIINIDALAAHGGVALGEQVWEEARVAVALRGHKWVFKQPGRVALEADALNANGSRDDVSQDLS